MPFPESRRVIYERNPLEEVVCQLKFPPILRIDSEPPAAFQETLRDAYPLLTESAATPLEIPPAIAKMIAAELPGFTGNRVYQFASRDDTWKVSLTRDFLAVSTREYKRWEGFRGRMAEALGALITQYKPAFFSRIGLRYRDVVRPTLLGLATINWSDLLEPHILGELSSKEVGPAIRLAARDVLVDLGQQGRQVRIRHGLGKVSSTDEACYVIDSDFYSEERTEVADVYEFLDFFNHYAGRLFRWCITRRLHELLGPHDI